MPKDFVTTGHFPCIACNTRFKIKPYMSGKRARCGKCQTKLRIPTLRTKLNEVAGTTKRKIVAAIPGMRGTGMGLLLGAWGTIIMLVAIVVAVTALTISTCLPVPFEHWRWAIGISLLGGALMTVVGMFVCVCVCGCHLVTAGHRLERVDRCPDQSGHHNRAGVSIRKSPASQVNTSEWILEIEKWRPGQQFF